MIEEIAIEKSKQLKNVTSLKYDMMLLSYRTALHAAGLKKGDGLSSGDICEVDWNWTLCC